MEQTKYDVFISYSRKDYVDEHGNVIPENEVTKIKEALTKAGITYWLDEYGEYYGSEYEEAVVRYIKASKVFVFLSTKNSNQSEWIAREISTAYWLKKKIIPVLLDDSVYHKNVGLYISCLSHVDYKDNPGKGIQELIVSIKSCLKEEKMDENQSIEEKKCRIEGIERQHRQQEKEFICRLKEEKYWRESLERELIAEKQKKEVLERRLIEEINRRIELELQLREAKRRYADIYEHLYNEQSESVTWALGVPKYEEREEIVLVNQEYYEIYSSLFALAEVKRKTHMLVQIYLHLFEETEKVKKLARESQKGAKRRDYRPLDCKLRKGDKVDVLFNIYGETLLMSDKKSVVWQGSFTKCSFDYFVPKDIDVDELSCVALLSVNGVPVGEMRFITKIVEYEPRQLNPEIIAHKYKKAFISYAHQDKASVKSFHDALDLYGIEHFFDRSF